MQRVSEAYRRELEQPVVGAAHLRVSLGLIDSDAAATAAPSSGAQSYWSAPSSALAAQGAQLQSWATFEPGRWKADGKLTIPAPPGGKLLAEGYVSEALSGADGAFTPAPVLDIHFSKTHTVAGLTFGFDRVAGEWPAELRVRAWRGEELLYDEVQRPDAAAWQLDAPLERFDRLAVSFLRSSRPRRRARLSQLMFGIGLTFEDGSLTGAKQTLEVDPIGRRLPTGKFEWQAVNINRLTGAGSAGYDPDDPAGIWRYFEQRNPIRVEYGQEISRGLKWGDAAQMDWASLELTGWQEVYEGGLVEWLPGGRFFLTGQPSTEGLFAKFAATDALGLLDDTYYKGVWDGEEHSLYELALAVLEDAGVPREYEDTPPWRLWEGLKEIGTTAPLPVKKHRECLQLIAHAGCCCLYVDREGYICLAPAPGGQSDVELGLRAILDSAPKVEKVASLLRVDCPATTYALGGEAKQLHKASYQVEGELALHLSWSQAGEVSATATGGSVAAAELYAAAGDITLTGNGPVELVVSGKALATSAQTASAPAPDADPSGAVEVLNNPLVTNPERAAAVAAWVRDYLLRRSTYSCATRGNPEFDPLDRVLLGTEFAARVPAQVLKNELEYSGGGLKGNLILKRGDTT